MGLPRNSKVLYRDTLILLRVLGWGPAGILVLALSLSFPNYGMSAAVECCCVDRLESVEFRSITLCCGSRVLVGKQRMLLVYVFLQHHE